MRILLMIALFVSLLITTAAVAGPSGYHVAKTYKLGGEGGWDYLTVDSKARRVYISRGTHVMVVDADTGAVVGDIPNTNGVHGIAIASEFDKGFISDGRGSDQKRNKQGDDEKYAHWASEKMMQSRGNYSARSSLVKRVGGWP